MVPVLVGAAAIWGLSNMAEAESNVATANAINKEAADMAQNAYENVSQRHAEMMDSLERLGETKKRTSIAIGFAGDYIQDITKKIKLDNDLESMRELEDAGIQEDVLEKMHILSQQVKELSMDNDKQSSMSGDDNSTCVLGALGGAALGFGVVAMPAMLLYSFIKSDEAESAYHKAKTRMDEARVFNERCNNMCALFKAITTRGEQIEDLIQKLNKYFVPSVEQLSNIVGTYGNDYKNYTPESKMAVFYSFQLAQTVKAIVETSMVQEDWSISPVLDDTVEMGEKTVLLLSSEK